jgi:hypothetical protein
MNNSQIEMTALIVTYAAFGALGFPRAHRFRRPVALPTWIFDGLVVREIRTRRTLKSA